VNDVPLAALIGREREIYAGARPKTQTLARRGARHFPQGVPMHWMRDWALPFPLAMREAKGAELWDVDGHRYVDFCLGDTGAMFGHSPPAVAAAIAAQAVRGLTAMLPPANTAIVGEQLAEIFGLPYWQVTQTATDANRAVLRHARALTGRPRCLVFNHCYHGTLDETLVVRGADGATLPRAGQIGRGFDPAATTVVVEFNDLVAVDRALARGDIGCVLAEPAMTNAGLVLPEPGFLEALAVLAKRYGALLAFDETHTLSAGRGGYGRRAGVAPDLLVCGKAIAGGMPCAVYGFTAEVEARMRAADATREPGHSGLGTTLSGNALALAALQACLGEVMTVDNHAYMDRLAGHLAGRLEAGFHSRGLDWHVSRVGARVEFGRGPPPRNGSDSIAAHDAQLASAMHLFLLNRGFLITPFHNMMLISPATSLEQLERFGAVFHDCLDAFATFLQARP
jgi:glutamate-1-semialdehyde 2,1-aminomutase